MKSSKYPPAPTAPPPSPLLLQLLDNLNCPVCIDKMEPPITMCVNGHSICCRCRQQLDRCPVCRGCHSPMRNFFAETAFSLLVDKVRCKYVASGCRHELLDRHEVEEHESLCQYRDFFECGITTSKASCKDVKVPIANLSLHMEATHRMKHVKRVYGTAVVTFPVDSKPETLNRHPPCDPWLIKCHGGKNFVAMRAYTPSNVYFWIVGDVAGEESKNYTASIFICNVNRTKKVLWEGGVLPALKGFSMISNQLQFGANEVLAISCKNYFDFADIDPETGLKTVKHVFKVDDL